MSLRHWLEAAWYRRDGHALWGLRPLEWLYRWGVQRRMTKRRLGATPVPVIVVGNLSVGGTGKSPLVAWLTRYLADNGWRPGIVARGYGGRAATYPMAVTANSSPREAGDEPVMLARHTGVPIAVAPQRSDAVDYLTWAGCDVIISDDGLQHYPMARDLELAVVDGQRGFGNGHCFPCGPLREPLSRLTLLDGVIVNGDVAALTRLQERHGLSPRQSFNMTLTPSCFYQLTTGQRVGLSDARFQAGVHAVAGIGHPERFFTTLTALGIPITAHPFADHHVFNADELVFADRCPIVMTAKDAVKCQSFATKRHWVLEVEAEPSPAFVLFLQQRLAVIMHAS